MEINVFELEHGKYFVGIKKPEIEWTTLHLPVSLYTSIPYNPSKYLTEDTVVREYMKRFGIDNVRGGSYSTVELTDEQIRELNIYSSDCEGCRMKNPGEHMRLHDGWYCSVCEQVFHRKEDYEAHCEKMKDRMKKCEYCDKHIDHDMEEGNESWHMSNRYHCYTCGQGFTKYNEEHYNEFSDHQDGCCIRIVN